MIFGYCIVAICDFGGWRWWQFVILGDGGGGDLGFWGWAGDNLGFLGWGWWRFGIWRDGMVAIWDFGGCGWWRFGIFGG